MNSSNIEPRKWIHRSPALRAFLLVAIALACFGISRTAVAVEGFANVIAVAYKPGAPTLDVEVALLKGIDNAARNGNADFGLRVTVSYTSANQTFETLDSGRLSIKNGTILGSNIDNRTVVVTLQIPFGAAPPPGGNPSYSATVQIVHRDGNGNDVELGPAELTLL